MTTYPNIGLTLPVQGAPGAGLWDDTQDANTALIDAHDHSPGKGVRITPAAININADLPLNSSWGITSANRISFASVAAPSTNKSLFVSDGTGGLTTGELYWRNASGSSVRLTSGTSLNVAAFTGGIGGDYVSVGAAVAFDDANDRYTFKQQSNLWARMASGDVRLFETGTTDSVYVGLAAPAALASSYSITLPLAAPGSTQIVQMDSAGVLTASNTVTNLITASAGVTAAANQHVTVSGTGEFKHGDRVVSIPGCGAAATTNWSVGSGKATSSGSGNSQFALPLMVGDRLKSVTFMMTGNATVDMTADINKQTSMVSADVSIGSNSANNVAASDVSMTVTVTSPAALGAAESVYLNVFANAAGLTYGLVRYTYDRP